MSGRARRAPKGGGAPQPHSSGRNTKQSCRRNTQAQSKRPKKQIDLCKVYVSNLSNKVTEHMLHKALSDFAEVEKVTIKKYKKIKKSNGCAIVTVKSSRDVQKLLTLREWDRNFQGQIFTIRGARNSIKQPGDDGYVPRPLSDRDFDLASPYPEQPSIHKLVDDIMLQVFSYLPLKCLLTCEGVCRRWQMLLHQYFSKKTNLELSEALLRTSHPLTETVIPKFLVLSGPNLRSLKIYSVKFVERRNILQIIGQLCPQLEYLDVSTSQGIDFTYIEELAERCENIKGFVARNCSDFSKSVLHRLLYLFPKLEKLNVLDTMVHCKDYEALPSTLKELHIDAFLDDPDEMTISMIADRCPNLEALTLREWEMSSPSLMYIGNTCHKLTYLSVHLDSGVFDNYTRALLTFKKLKELEVFAGTLDLKLLFKSLPQLEVLTLCGIVGSKDVDFSILKKLKSLRNEDTHLTEASLMTVTKCREMEDIAIDSLSEEMAVDILQGCSKLKAMTCPKLQISRSLLTQVDQVMKDRPGKVVIKLRDKYSIVTDFARYDRDKIEFLSVEEWGDSSESESSSNDYFSDFDSDDSILEPWLFW